LIDQIILLDDNGTRVEQLAQSRVPTGSQTCDVLFASQTTMHHVRLRLD